MPVIIKPIQANLTRDTELIARMDPYVKVWLGNEQKRSSVCKNGSKNPYWTDSLQFMSNGTMLRVQVWDDDVMLNDFIGEGTFNISPLYNMPPGQTQNQYIDLFYQGRSAGRILMSFEHQMGMGMGNQMGMGMGMGMNQGQWGQQQGYNGGSLGWGNQGVPGLGGDFGSWGNNGGFGNGGFNGGFNGGYNGGFGNGWGNNGW